MIFSFVILIGGGILGAVLSDAGIQEPGIYWVIGAVTGELAIWSIFACKETK